MYASGLDFGQLMSKKVCFEREMKGSAVLRAALFHSPAWHRLFALFLGRDGQRKSNDGASEWSLGP